MNAKSCSIAGCGSPKYIRGWCNSHYLRWRRNGDPLGGKTAPGAARKWLDQHKDYAGADCLIWPFFTHGLREWRPSSMENHNNDQAMMRFEWSWNRHPPEFYPLPQPPVLPPKVEPPAAPHFEL